MQVIGLCRFSYPALGGFQVDFEDMADKIAYLYDPARMEERFHLFETVALKCLRHQTDPDFELVIVVGDQLPAPYLARLQALIRDMPQARIEAHPPRNHREVMKEVLNTARRDPAAPCLQFRYDDDDAVAVDFIERLRQAAVDCAALSAQHKAIAFDWTKGYIANFGASGINATPLRKTFNVAGLAMQIRGNSPLTIMNFAHERIGRFMPCVSFAEPTMFIRGHNTTNDSRQKKVKPVELIALDDATRAEFADRFAIDEAQVRRVFSAGAAPV
ncbi:putative rhamnosyl transferase [Sulfitobacter sp. S190]|uniref:putative rhamnosyl transferase n=1 Tax=Sulfitobacter sp. S190 TaxID=2867022 RepID=UPI0021A531D8|nr:putative rhamnosyl transferase [Sulfitobacter sp. S190]UWR22953.1 putative rhamnosyl transferase [Sulfitobacter sp. S190]